MIGLLTPMANPTVERELRRLLPDDVDYVVGRLTSDEADSTKRLRAYAEHLDCAVRQFGGMPLSALAFACTASSYLVGREGEDRIAARLRQPVLWAAATVRDALGRARVRRIAVISPYPAAIHAAGLAYWQACGFALVFDRRIEIGSEDTRAIYALGQDAAQAAIDEARQVAPDAILLSGTGMATLSLVESNAEPRVLSSNHCLAAAMIAQANGASA